MDKLGIVVPCYNEEEVLEIASKALREVLTDLISKQKIAEDSCTSVGRSGCVLRFYLRRVYGMCGIDILWYKTHDGCIAGGDGNDGDDICGND